MRNNIIIVAILFLIIGATLLALIPLVNAFSETIPLNSDSTRTVEVELGDRIVGNCTFFNTPTPNGVNISYAYAIYRNDASNQDARIKNIVFARSNEEYTSFDITSDINGIYILEFYHNFYGSPTDSAKVTLNYQVLKLSSTSSLNPSPTIPEFQSLLFFMVLAGLISFSIITLRKSSKLFSRYSLC
jgi:hypothetical protein